METEVLVREIARKFDLGELAAPPQRVPGGFLHKMYKLQTASGVYALKLLNPVIMRRPDAMGNYQKAEMLERVLEENDIPVIAALERNGEKMQCLDGQYYYLFDWSEGKALDWHEIGEEHCRIAGKLLARIHRISCGVEREASGQKAGKYKEGKAPESPGREIGKEMQQEVRAISGQDVGNAVGEGSRELTGEDSREAGSQVGLFDVDWDGYIRRAAVACPEIAEELAENRELLYLAQREYNAAVRSVPEVRCICDGDMDCKNVLWVDGKPFLIDLECLDYGNPFTEMFQLALSWAGGAVCELDIGRFAGFVDAYRDEYGEVPVDWKVLSGVGYSWLDWLAYNVRRGLRIECGDEEERQLGIRETHETIRRIRYYHSVREELGKIF